MEDLDFADDISLLDSSESKTVDHISCVEQLAALVGLKINYGKTEFMSLPALGHDFQLPNNETVQEVEDFKYLGPMMNSCQSDLKTRR